MKHVSLLFLVATLLIISCNESQTKTEATAPADTSKSVENKIMIPSSTCYSSITGKDTFKLKIEVFPNVVTGKLSYQFLINTATRVNLRGSFMAIPCSQIINLCPKENYPPGRLSF